MALTADRDAYEVTDQRTLPPVPAAAATTIYAGGSVCLDASGNAVPAADGAGDVYGVAQEEVDNSAGSAGDLSVKCNAGIFHFTNSSGDPVAAADVLNTVFAEADDIAAKTQNATGTLPKLGRFLGIDADHGVKVFVGKSGVDSQSPKLFVELVIPALSSGDEVYTAMPVDGRIVGAYATLDAAISGADANLTIEINGTPTTGGLLTVSQPGAAGAVTTATAITALNYAAAGATLSVVDDGASTGAVLCNVTLVIQPDV